MARSSAKWWVPMAAFGVVMSVALLLLLVPPSGLDTATENASYSDRQPANNAASDENAPPDSLSISGARAATGDHADIPTEDAEWLTSEGLLMRRRGGITYRVMGKDYQNGLANGGASNAGDSAPEAAINRSAATGLASVSGRVVSEAGARVPGVQVRLVYTDDSRAVAIGMSNGDGEYSIYGLHPGTAYLVAEPAAGLPYFASPRQDVIIAKEDRRENLVLTLSKGDYIDGIVYTMDNEPIEGAGVTAMIRDIARASITGADGRFRITGVPPGGAAESLTVSQAGYQTATRTMVSMLDGEQTFFMKAANDITLTVTWAMDATPVEYYAFRLLRAGPSGLYNLERPDQIVESETGSAVLGNLADGGWRIELNVIDPATRVLTSLRAGGDFQVDVNSAREWSIVVNAGGVITGHVLASAEGPPVEGAFLEFVPPGEGFGRFPPPDPRYAFPTSTSGAGGYFELVGLAPGIYTLKASKDELISTDGVVIDVPYDKNPDPVDVILSGGGVIYGTVIGRDGNPPKSGNYHLSIQRPVGDGWIWRDRVTLNPEGTYRETGIPTGTHYVWMYADDQSDSRTFDIAGDQEVEVNFDFTGMVELSGALTVSGSSAFGEPTALDFANGETVRAATLDGGKYSILVKPGSYFLRVDGSAGVQAQGQTNAIEVSESPAVQTRDVRIDLVDIDVLLEFPDDYALKEAGDMVISPEVRGRRYSFMRYKVAETRKHLPAFIAGDYDATFTTRDKEWMGSSGLTSLSSTGDSTMVIEMRRKQGMTRIGAWTPADVSNIEVRDYDFDVTPYIQSEGELEVLVDYDRGYHAMETHAVELLRNGSSVDRDGHLGWTGGDDSNNVYRVSVAEYEADSRWTIRVSMKSDGGTDSYGSVYLTVK